MHRAVDSRGVRGQVRADMVHHGQSRDVGWDRVEAARRDHLVKCQLKKPNDTSDYQSHGDSAYNSTGVLCHSMIFRDHVADPRGLSSTEAY